MNDFRGKVNTTIVNFFNKKPVKFLSEKFKKLEKMRNAILKGNDVITLTPGTIFQIHNVTGDLKIYFFAGKINNQLFFLDSFHFH